MTYIVSSGALNSYSLTPVSTRISDHW